MNPNDDSRWGHFEVDRTSTIALVYLSLPNLIFLIGWFRWPFAIVLCGLVLHLLTQTQSGPLFRGKSGRSITALFLIVVTAFSWAAFGGGSHFMHANPDWYVRDAVIGDLVFSEWPVHYISADGTSLILRSAIGYYLPPAVFGRICGIDHIGLFIYFWTASGVLIFLLLLPLPERAGWKLGLGLVLVVFFSGMDFLGQIIATESLPQFPLRLEWWVPLSYPSLTNQLLWAPNHCLPLWISTLLILRHLHANGILRMTLALIPLTLIWTPFASIGIAPFAMLGAVSAIRFRGWDSTLLPGVISATLLTTVLAMYLLLDIGQINAGFASGATAKSTNYTLHSASPHAYLLFISCEFLLLAISLAPYVNQSRGIFILAILMLLTLPVIRFGPSNDILLRMSTPPLIVLLVTCLDTIFRPVKVLATSTLAVSWLFLAIGAHTAFNEFWRSATFPRTHADYLHSLADKQEGIPAAHYVARSGTSPIALLLKPIGVPANHSNRELR